jgi:hypothetical protein
MVVARSSVITPYAIECNANAIESNDILQMPCLLPSYPTRYGAASINDAVLYGHG